MRSQSLTLKEFEAELLSVLEDCLNTDIQLNGFIASDEAKKALGELMPLVRSMLTGRTSLVASSVKQAEQLRREFPDMLILVDLEAVRDYLPKELGL